MTHPNSHEGRHQSFPDATGPLLSQLDKCRALYEHSPIAIELYNRDGVLEGVNDSCLQLFGIAGMEEILGFSLFSDPNLTSENKDKLRAGNGVRYRGPFDFGLVRAMKLYNTSRSGVIWLDVQITPFAAGEEGGGGFLVQIQDITEQISTERALQESEEKFRHLYDNAPVGLYRSTPDGRILLGNRMICQMLGFNSFEELSARNLEESGFGEQSDRSEFIRQIETTGEVRDLESNWLDSKGSVRVVRENARVVRDAEGRTICYEGSVEDITDARRIEKALRETEKKYQRIASNIKDAVYSVDGSNGEYSYLSPAFRDLTGYSEEDIAAMGGRMAFLTSVLPAGLAQEHRSRFDFLKVQTETGATTDEIWWRCKDGTVKCLADHWTPVYRDGILVSTDGVLRDITATKRTEQALNEALERAEASDRLKTAFMNNISHEVRTPLNGILGFVDMLDMPDVSPEDRILFKEILHESTDRLLATINSYMDISLLVSGNMPVNKSDFSMVDLLREGFVHFSDQAAAKGLRVNLPERNICEGCVTHSDRDLVRKVYWHLLENAIKFSEFGTIDIGCRNTGPEIEITIADSGVGIQPELRDRIFDTFLQGDVSNTRRYEGSGLGLAIVKGLIDLIGGRIWVTSEPGYGSTFGFVIPAKSQMAVPVPTELPAGTEQVSRPFILVAEDDQINIFLLESMLGKLETEYCHVENGRLAVEFCLANPEVSLVLMDLKMPEMDGFEATRRIKAMRPGLPVIAVTAYAMPGDREQAIEAGCDDYMSKPFTSAQLTEKLGRYIVL